MRSVPCTRAPTPTPFAKTPCRTARRSHPVPGGRGGPLGAIRGRFLQNPLLGPLLWNGTVPSFNFGRVVFAGSNLNLILKNYLEWKKKKKTAQPRLGEGGRWRARLAAGTRAWGDRSVTAPAALEAPPGPWFPARPPPRARDSRGADLSFWPSRATSRGGGALSLPFPQRPRGAHRYPFRRWHHGEPPKCSLGSLQGALAFSKGPWGHGD